ncbi:MAG: ABC transporter ATP-binding protein, partial [Pseudomonadales bacterium]|nr:ABC transporter ATP-binding protein [Pseudomonadales bacterium]
MIKVSNISKTYLLWRTPTSRLLVPAAHRLVKPWSPTWYSRFEEKHCEPVNALSNISFDLEKGASLGIIGLNGSGKSTLLQIIAGTLQPSSGSVEVQGRVAALLELGSGFDPEFSGRENVYLNATILGLRREEIDARYEDIVNFADIGSFINHPVKSYSSGMVLRLAFAVQVHVEPDILIVDEALAVGDARFQAKALSKIEDILAKGTTLLFVGHDLKAVKAFCNQAILLNQGSIARQGLPDDVIMDYLQQVQQDKHKSLGRNRPLSRTDAGFAVSGFGITHASINETDTHADVQYEESIDISLSLNLPEPVSHPYLIMDLVDASGLQLTGKRIAIPQTNPATLATPIKNS